MKPYPVVFACIAGLIGTGNSIADQARNPFGLWYLADQPEGWYYDAIVGFEREPTYTGSDRYESEADFNARAFYQTDTGRRYFVAIGEAGAVFDLNEDLLFATVLEYEEARENGEDPILEAFPEDDDTLEAQISLAKRWGNWSLAAVFQPDILDRGKGLVYFVGAGYDRMLSDRLRLNSSIDISFSDSEHINTEVGIPQDIALLSGLESYEADGGYKSTTVSLALGYQMQTNLELLFNAEVEIYGSEMRDSPLIADEGDDINYELGLGLRYSF